MSDILIPTALIFLLGSASAYLAGRFLQWLDWQWWYRNWYLHSPHWQIVRWLKKIHFRLTHHGALYCEKCMRDNRLQVHHVTYSHLGHEHMSDLQIVCFQCHRPGGGRIA